MFQRAIRMEEAKSFGYWVESYFERENVTSLFRCLDSVLICSLQGLETETEFELWAAGGDIIGKTAARVIHAEVTVGERDIKMFDDGKV